MMYRLAVCLVATFCVGLIHAQTCQTNNFKGKVWFILDQSEIARGESTSSNMFGALRYDMMRNAIRNFAAGFGPSDDVEIGLVGYSQRTDVSVGLTPATTLVNLLDNQQVSQLIPDDIVTNNFVSSGGSFTSNGLQAFFDLNLRSPVPNYQNVVVVVSASGSFDPARQIQAVTFARSIVSSGFTMVLYAVNSASTNIDVSEMNAIGQVTQLNSYITLPSYNNLAASLVTQVRNRYLCVVPTTFTTPTPTTTRSTTTLSPDHPCAKCAQLSGLYIVPHPETCSKYLQCNGLTVDGAYNVQEFDCGPGTLFNQTTAVCVQPLDYNCPAWGGQCRQGSGVRDYAHLCCGMYWSCDNGNVTESYCPIGQMFSQDNQRCQTPASGDECLQTDLCKVFNKPSIVSRADPEERCTVNQNALLADNNNCCWRYYNCTNGVGQSMYCPDNQVFDSNTRQCSSFATTTCAIENCGCYLTAVAGDPCEYISGGQTMRCAEGTQFSQRGCNCFDSPNGCPKKVRDAQDGFGRVVGECAAGVHISFDTDFGVVDEILGATKNMWIATNDVTIADNSALFQGNQGATGSVLFIPYFANRAFADSFGIKLQVLFDSSSNALEYVLISNDRCNQCIPTLRVTASRTSTASSQWTFTFWAKGATSEASVSTSVSVNSNNDQFTDVEVKVSNGVLSGTVSPAQSAPGTLTGNNNNLGENVQVTDCGLSIGQGQSPSSNTLVALDGRVNDFKYYECADLTTLV